MITRQTVVESIEHCPVEVAMAILGKKWTIHVIRDLFRGFRKFSDFLKLNPQLSTRVLSLRLKELTEEGLVDRVIISESPLQIEYHLTEKGIALNNVIVALSEFSITEYPDRVFASISLISEQNIELAIEAAEDRFGVISSVGDY